MNVTRVAILGAGNGGITAAADLKNRGKEVSLYELPRFGKTIDLLKKAGKITVKEGQSEFSAIPDLMTTDIGEAVKGAQVILVTVPSFAIEEFAKVLAPVAREDQVIIIHCAASMGTYRFLQTAKAMRIEKKFKIGELNTLAYGTRAFPDKGLVELSLRVKYLLFAALPADDTEELLVAARQLYSAIQPVENIWHILLTNGNPEAHCACILNAGRIEYSKGEFWYYVEGVTPHTINIMRAVDQERMALGRAMGFELESGREARVKRGYLRDEPDTPYEELFNTSDVFSAIKGPLSVDSRYLVEDISNGLAMYSSLGKAVGVLTPVSDAIVTLGGCLLQRDFQTSGLTLERLGFDGLDAKSLSEAVN